MSIYPIKVKKQSGRADSTSGGKDYHLVLLTAANGRALFITRFGRKGTWGVGFNVERFESLNAARRAYDRKFAAKIGKDYDEILVDIEVPCKDEAELRRALGEQYWNKVGASNLEWLVPGVDTKGVRELRESVPVAKPDPAELFGRAKSKYATPAPEPPKPVETAEERVKTTPIWGMF